MRPIEETSDLAIAQEQAAKADLSSPATIGRLRQELVEAYKRIQVLEDQLLQVGGRP
jgi:hypothetical protein